METAPVTHHRFSPSSATRWTSCTASIPLITSINPPRTSSEYAALGTFLHEIRAEALTLGIDVHHFVGETRVVENMKFEMTAAHADAMQPGIDGLRLLAKDRNLIVEGRVSLTEYIPGCFGTSDAIVWDDDVVCIDDFKSGAGHAVDPDGNFQMMLYAAGFLSSGKTQAKRVILSIDQPFAGGLKTWETTREYVEMFAQECGKIAADIIAGKTVYVANDDNCRWCPVMSACPENAKRNIQLCGFTGKVPKLPTKITPRQRSKILMHKDQIERWLSALHAEALADAIAGKKVPGFKAVEGRRGNRRWADEVAAEIELSRHLGDKAYERKLITPAQAEKRLTRDCIPNTVQSEGKPCLVEDSDERPSITLF